MAIKVDPPDEAKAAGGAALKAGLARLVPGLDVALAAYDALEAKRREKAFEDFKGFVLSRLERMEGTHSFEWLGTEDGQVFAGKVFSAALDAQMADKREIFSHVLINGVLSEDLTARTKMMFVDLLRRLSRVSLDVLAEIHVMCGPALKTTGSSYISDTDISRYIAEKTGMDPYLVGAAVADLRAAGLFSSVASWRKDLKGKPLAHGGWADGGQGYTEFTERFVQFIKEPQ